VKIFVVADPKVRARRRTLEARARGEDADEAAVLADILQRDERDKNRPVAPLKAAPDAYLLDNSNLDIEGGVRAAIDIVEAVRAGRSGTKPLPSLEDSPLPPSWSMPRFFGIDNLRTSRPRALFRRTVSTFAECALNQRIERAGISRPAPAIFARSGRQGCGPRHWTSDTPSTRTAGKYRIWRTNGFEYCCFL